MVSNALTVALAILIFTTGISWSIRVLYVHEFRTADVNVFTYTLLADVSKNGENVQAYRNIAREWLRVSEDYRIFSISLSYLTSWLLLSTVLIALSLVASFLRRFYVCLPLTIVGIVLFALGILTMTPKYGYMKPIPWLELFSDKICERIPALATSHLDRWKEIQNIIETHEWLKDVLKEPIRVSRKANI